MTWKLRNRIIVLCLILVVLVVSSVFIYNSISARSLLYWGSRNSDVRLVQRKLQQWGYYDGSVDGVYGNQTFAAVRDFQRRNGLRVDGVVGPETWAALGYDMSPEPARQTVATNISRNDEIEMIARLISAEARGEPYEGQVAVGAVLLNRVNSPRFPNTLAGVIYQPLAFEAVADGQFYMAPTESSRRAARAALNGWDPTYGSEFFWNPGEPVNPWVWTRQTVRTIGNHVFAR